MTAVEVAAVQTATAARKQVNDLIREEHEHHPDRESLIQAVAARLPDSLVLELKHTMVRYLVHMYDWNGRVQARRDLHVVGEDEKGNNKSDKWERIRRIQEQIFSVEGGTKKLQDMTMADCLSAAKLFDEMAAGNKAQASRMRACAKELEKRKAKTVSDLPAKTLAEIFR